MFRICSRFVFKEQSRCPDRSVLCLKTACCSQERQILVFLIHIPKNQEDRHVLVLHYHFKGLKVKKFFTAQTDSNRLNIVSIQSMHNTLDPVRIISTMFLVSDARREKLCALAEGVFSWPPPADDEVNCSLVHQPWAVMDTQGEYQQRTSSPAWRQRGHKRRKGARMAGKTIWCCNNSPVINVFRTGCGFKRQNLGEGVSCGYLDVDISGERVEILKGGKGVGVFF